MEEISEKITESRNRKSTNLDRMTTYEIVRLMNDEDKKIGKSIEPVLEDISFLIDDLIEALNQGGRLIYIGAGTSGRLGVLDAVECPPTFSTTDEVLGLIAGGDKAMFKAVENSEDSMESAIKDLDQINICEGDFLIGIAASGSTPYVLGGLKYARDLGAKTGSVACNLNSEISKYSNHPIEVDLGPEILTGSTRLKAGTATKMILNMISTASMVGIGKVYQNYMVDLKASNHKLKTRSESIVMDVTGVDRSLARKKLIECKWDVKVTIFSILSDKDHEESKKKLESAGGFLRKALDLEKGASY